MQLKHAVMVSLMGRQADRFHEYQPARDLAERLAMVKRVRGVEGIEIVYPQDFSDPNQTIAMVQDAGLPVSAVNLNVKSAEKWRRGSFTAPDPQLRADAIAELKTAMDLAAELGAWMVTCCPLIDGHNYNFQADYLKQWRWLEEGIAEAARYRSDVRISLEYKLNEARNYIILGDMGRTLYLCERLGLPNVGVTMDVGHALVAKETPAEVMCLAAQTGRLFYVHFNDNGREWDWDMLPGSVNLWDLVEMLFYLERLDWEGWLAYDVLTRDGDPVETMEATIAIVEAARELLDKLGRDRLQAFIEEGIPARAYQHLVRALL
ncbi:MAG: sugar phosphate isomerase/epimerase [Chloroflexi bacterium]|nr:sugar phosphate isomerase/epimerase [Chloroflexota bacterium]